ncbi:MAG: HAD-IIIA family hydrolase [Bacteroidetes bacterium]|nr:HAD-IIIA family hydrolase [Bacteroidota bacterium]
MARRQKKFTNLPFIKMLILDVDGVLTDGGIYYSTSGDEMKRFHIHDGYGMLKLRRAGIAAAILTGRVSSIVERRAHDLGISEVHQNLENKLEVYEMLKQKYSLTDQEIAYIGDDEFDLPVLERVGFSAAPANAMERVKERVHYVCSKNGGEGAVREVIELILSVKK